MTKADNRYRQECQATGVDLPVDSDDNRYTGSKVALLHECVQEHLYYQTPTVHLSDHGCSVCATERVAQFHAKDDSTYRQECSSKGYDLPLDGDDNRYSNRSTALWHECQKGHGFYLQRPGAHMASSGCRTCANLSRIAILTIAVIVLVSTAIYL
jgi:hypothetical protein